MLTVIANTIVKIGIILIYICVPLFSFGIAAAIYPLTKDDYYSKAERIMFNIGFILFILIGVVACLVPFANF